MRNFILIIAVMALIFSSCDNKPQAEEVNMEEVKKTEQEFNSYAENIEKQIADVYRQAATAYWDASISGTPEDFEKAAKFEMDMNALFADKEIFAKLKEYKESNNIKDLITQRRLLFLYNGFLGYQIDTAKLNVMTQLSSDISQKFQNFRANVNGKELTDNEIEDILKNSKDNKKLQDAWEGHKAIGPLVAEDVVKLVKMRNEVAKELGFNNYHEMSLTLSDQDPKEIDALFKELDNLTRDSFKALKAEIDDVIAKQCNITIDDLRPWHYQNRYFQEAPKIYEIDLDKYYEKYTKEDIVKLTNDYFASINMPVQDIIDRSDLFEKKGKSQHAFCTDIDRNIKDIRILCNVRPNANWMNTMLHEFGHGVYFKYHADDLPWILKTPAHIFTTEAIAMLFGRMSSNPQWLQDMTGIDDEEKVKIAETAHKILTLEQLVFSRWSQVMYNFEKSLYENPDQDLNKLWWEMVEKYQMVKPVEGRDMPDWATKVHITSSPCYYHNYHLGELLASQLHFYIKDSILKLPENEVSSYYNNPEVGKYLVDMVFAPGAKYYWNDMIEKATGEKLTPKYYAKQFVK